jgi:hypothetical protein
MTNKEGFLYRNGLSIAFLILFLTSLLAQAYMGWHEHNDFLNTHHQSSTSFAAYLGSGHFIQATFENWESEFFQMALFVIFTIFLRQRGSSESKKDDEETIDTSELTPKKDSPWPVIKGGFYLELYKHSLSIALMLLFLISLLLHWYGSWLDHNEKHILEGKRSEEFLPFLCNSKFWFESFQNWQSEFLSVFSIIFLSIYLRQIGSSQSKAVNEPHFKTGAE